MRLARLNRLLVAALCLLPLVGGALEVEQISLKNGMRAVVVSDHRTPVVVHSVWYPAGSADEQAFNPQKTGIAHMLEHLMFKGTPTIPAGEFSKIVARMGGIDNAFTSRDYTAYYQKIGAHRLADVMAMEAERMRDLQIASETFVPERSVVQEERRMRVESNPIGKFFEQLVAEHYGAHPYAHPVIGWADHIANYQLEDAQNWYKAHYTPDGAVLLVVGDVTVAGVKPLFEKNYKNKVGHAASARAWPVLPPFAAPKVVKQVDAHVQVPVIYRVYRAPSAFAGVAGAAPATLKQIAALKVFTTLVGDGSTGFLHRTLVEDKKLATAATLDYSPTQRAESSLDLFVQPATGISMAAATQAAEQVLQEATAQITQENVAKAATQLRAAEVYAQDDPFGLAYRLGRWLMAGGTVETYGTWVDALAELTVEDVRNAAQFINIQQSTTGWLVNNSSQFGAAE
jgi:zinc protease